MKSGDRVALVACSIDLRFLPEDLDRAVGLLVSAVGPTEARSGCRQCSVARDAAEEGWVHYSEAWDSEDAFRRHVKSEVFLRVLAAMDMCREEPTVMIGNLSGHSGMAYLRELRDPESGCTP